MIESLGSLAIMCLIAWWMNFKDEIPASDNRLNKCNKIKHHGVENDGDN